MNGTPCVESLHDGIRGLRTELDLRNESTWGKQLTAIRADISNSLQSEIDSVPGRIRRILRQRADKDISAGLRIDSVEVDEADLLTPVPGRGQRPSQARRAPRVARSACASAGPVPCVPTTVTSCGEPAPRSSGPATWWTASSR